MAAARRLNGLSILSGRQGDGEPWGRGLWSPPSFLGGPGTSWKHQGGHECRSHCLPGHLGKRLLVSHQVWVTVAKGPFPFLRDPHNASLEGEGMPALFSASMHLTAVLWRPGSCPPAHPRAFGCPVGMG